MKTKFLFTLCFIILHSSFCLSAHGQGTGFTYQGRLNDGGSPANGSNDFTFAVFLVASGGSPIAGPIKVDDVIVSNGLFTATVDFGSGVFTGAVQWLEIGVRPGESGGGYTDLAPRQPITPTPYAIHAGEAATATYAATTVWAGVNGVPPGFADGVDNDTTYSAGLGLALTGTTFSLNPLFTDGRYWTLFGNSGTSAGPNFLGTTDNQPLEIRVNNQRALRLEPNTNGAPNLIGGSPRNFVAAGVVGATIAGGGATNYFGLSTNSVLADFGVVGGGGQNAIATGSGFATIAGGHRNDIGTNSASSAIGGGLDNNIAADSQFATIAGGRHNDIGTSCGVSVIGGGFYNNIAADSLNSTIAGGWVNDIGPNSDSSAIGGGAGNNIAANAAYATIAGGSSNDIGTNSDYSAIGGGYDNEIAANSSFATIAGGYLNDIGMSSYSSTIGGGYDNNIESGSTNSTIAGGYLNDIGTNSFYSTIGGGYGNNIAADVSYVTIAGGERNDIGTNSFNSAIGGGRDNNIAANASYATIAGGYLNDIGINSSYGAIGGGNNNNIAANAAFATIPGGENNTATFYAFAAGRQAKAIHEGAFVWGDSTAADIASTTANSVTMRAAGGYRLFSNSGATAGVSLAAGGTAWAVISDRNVKKDFAPLDSRGILEKLAALPITRWHYRWEEQNVTPHIGPMAQDFKAAFYPGADDKSITTQEADGVALAAIQGLNQKLEKHVGDLRLQLQTRDAELHALRDRLENLERTITLSGKRN